MIVFMTKIPSHLSSAQMTDVKKLTVKFENKKTVGLRICTPISVSLISLLSRGVDSALWKNAMKSNDVFPRSVLFLCLLVCAISQALGTFRYSTALSSHGVFRETVSFNGVDPWVQKCGREPLQDRKMFSLKKKLLDLCRWIHTSASLHLFQSAANNPLVQCDFSEFDTVSHSPFGLSKRWQLPIETGAPKVAVEFRVLKLVLKDLKCPPQSGASAEDTLKDWARPLNFSLERLTWMCQLYQARIKLHLFVCLSSFIKCLY